MMNFTEIAEQRQSCRSYDPAHMVEGEKLNAILAAARLAPSACNAQPYHITVCKGEAAKAIAKITEEFPVSQRFVADAPVLLVISEAPAVAEAFRDVDIGILVAYITAEATVQGLGSCILGWGDSRRVRAICHLDTPTRLVIALGYAKKDDPLRPKKRKALAELVDVIG